MRAARCRISCFSHLVSRITFLSTRTPRIGSRATRPSILALFGFLPDPSRIGPKSNRPSAGALIDPPYRSTEQDFKR
jgi:hypothetical protein